MHVHHARFQSLTVGYSSKSEDGFTGGTPIKGAGGSARSTIGPTKISNGPSLQLRSILTGAASTGSWSKRGGRLLSAISRFAAMPTHTNRPRLSILSAESRRRCMLIRTDALSRRPGDRRTTGRLCKCLSRMSGNYHVRFLGRKEAAKPPTYPVMTINQPMKA